MFTTGEPGLVSLYSESFTLGKGPLLRWDDALCFEEVPSLALCSPSVLVCCSPGVESNVRTWFLLATLVAQVLPPLSY